MTRTLRILSTLLCLTIPTVALAEDAMSLMEKGIRAYTSGRSKAAYDLFKQAEALDPTGADVLSNLGRLTEAMELWEEAAIYWTAYLAHHSESIAPALKDAAEKSLAKASKSIYHRATLVAKTVPATAWIKVNGTSVGKGSVTLAVAGEKPYIVQAELADHKAPEPVTITLAAKEERTHTMRLEAITFFGTVELQIFPQEGVQVFVDTIEAGDASKPLQVAEGRRLICFKKTGYDRWWRYLEIRRSQSQVLKADLREKTRADEPCNVLPPLDQRQ